MTTKTNFEYVCEFNETFDFPVYPVESQPLVNQLKVSQYRFYLIREEGIEEFSKALCENDYVEITLNNEGSFKVVKFDHVFVCAGIQSTYNLTNKFFNKRNLRLKNHKQETNIFILFNFYIVKI